MYWNIFVRPKCNVSEQADVCVTSFSTNDEQLVRELFYKRHIGLDIITASHHRTQNLAYKQIEMLGSAIRSHFEFHEPSMICPKCGLESVGSMSHGQICDFCYIESEYPSKTSKPGNNN